MMRDVNTLLMAAWPTAFHLSPTFNI